MKGVHLMGRQKKGPFAPSSEIQAIRDKLQADPTGATLTRGERNREILKDEVAYLLSTLAGRTIDLKYVFELMREDKGRPPRLRSVRSVGTVHIFRVSDLLPIKFNKMQEKIAQS
jgi:hypothetical protein